jgi:hypothetical protein
MTMKTKTRNGAVLAFLLLALAPGQAQQPELKPLRSLEQLEQSFDSDAGIPRLVLLLSPT